jgi:hypothetical protein
MDDIDVDAIVADLKANVTRRRLAGDYPPGMEEQLEAEFVTIMRAVHRDEIGTSELGVRVGKVADATTNLRIDSANDSRVPGGSSVHAVAGRLIRRHTGALAASVRSLGAEVTAALHEVQRLFEVQREADERQINEILSAVIDRVAVIDHLADAVVDL